MSFFFFFNDTATTEIYTLSLHDALPISMLTGGPDPSQGGLLPEDTAPLHPPIPHPPQWIGEGPYLDPKSTRLNSSHRQISYAGFCLEKKKQCTSTPRPCTTSIDYRHAAP